MDRASYDFMVSEMKTMGIDLTEEQVSQFDRYYELLIEWNEKMNLTAITEFDDVILKHFIDSVSLIRLIDPMKIESVIDVGTGAGFPGLPIKIAFPHLKITLLDSLNKRINFLNEVIDQLHLKNISTIHGRAEDVSRETDHRGTYDVCVSRAVANLSTLTELCIPFVKKDGCFIPYKSEKAEDEINAAKQAFHLLGCKYETKEEFSVGDNYRNLLLIRKIENTSKKYPRKAGTPAKNPL